MVVRGAAAALILGVLAACTQTGQGTDGARAPGPSDACGASKLQALVGKPLGSLDVKTLPSSPRQIGPDMAVDADYQPDRLNIEYDAGNRITKVSCF